MNIVENKYLDIIPMIFFFGLITSLVLWGVLGMQSLEFAGKQTDKKLQEIAGEGYIVSNSDGFANVWDFDLYNSEGVYLGRYHMEEPFWYFFDEQGAYDNIKITKLQQPLKNHQQDGEVADD